MPEIYQGFNKYLLLPSYGDTFHLLQKHFLYESELLHEELHSPCLWGYL